MFIALSVKTVTIFQKAILWKILEPSGPLEQMCSECVVFILIS